MHKRIACRFGLAEPRARVREYLEHAGAAAGLAGRTRRSPADPEEIATPTSPCPCSPWPGWPPAGPRRKKGAGTGDPGMIGYTLPELRRLPKQPRLCPGTRPQRRLVLVSLAPETSIRPAYATTGDEATLT